MQKGQRCLCKKEMETRSLNKNQLYTSTLNLTYWIASQLSEDAKRFFQKEVIKGVDDLTVILNVLGTNPCTMEDDTQSLLAQRVRDEWSLIEKAYCNRFKDRELASIKNLVNKLLPNFK